jgi:hypothetical protein
MLFNVTTPTLACADLSKDCPCHHITRGEFRSGNRLHEALALAVDEHRPFTTQGLGGQRHRITTGRDGGRMELNELEIAQDSASTGCERQSASYRTQGISGVRVKTSDPTCRQDHGPTQGLDGLMSALGTPRGAKHTGHLTVCVECEVSHAMALPNLDRRSIPDSIDEGLQNAFAGSIPIRMNNPPARVCGFQPEDQAIPRRGSIKARALGNEPFDARGCGGGHAGSDLGIAETSASLQGVGRMQGRVIIIPESGRDPTLRQRRGGLLP